MNKIYIEKLAEVSGGLPARSKEEYIDGQYQGDSHSIPVEYNLEGVLTVSYTHLTLPTKRIV